MRLPDHLFHGAASILDVGGWFRPEPRATHVIDLMPWETRGAQLTLERLPGECFTKATWFQADFLKAGFRLPFPDKSFDLVVCGHTVEDLAEPGVLLREMQRVGKRGAIECPSRLSEQTKGIRDRKACLPGHPHHHWIVEAADGVLQLCSKRDSDLTVEARLIPLVFTEHRTRSGHGSNADVFPWVDRIDFRFVAGDECRRRATDFVTSLNISKAARIRDALLRFARRIKYGHAPEDYSWWNKIVETSRPYSRIELG